ncbi:hypothetical protein HK101_001902 [Irineochytrium annulatum]|nr:hypothetical protein HK101_001902 [Irineochytrium annulatum]
MIACSEADRVVLVQTNTELETQVGLLRQGYEETHAALQAQVGEREREAVIRAECVEENVRLKEEVGTLTRQAAEYKGMCENCLATADTLATLEDEKAYLLAEMRDMKAKAQKQDRALKSAHLHLDSLRSLTTLQTEALQDLTSLSRDACAASARPALMDRQARRDLSARCAQLEKDYTELATQLEHCRAERSRLAGWVERHRGAVDDYAECMKHVDLAPDDGCVHDDDEDAVDDDPPLPDSLAKPRPGPVCRHIARLTRRIAQLTRLNSTHTRLERDHALLQQAVRVERSRSARALEAVERKVAEVVGTCERMREERDAAMVECERVMREVGRAERIGREEVERVRAELEEAVERANASLKSARESYESDRLRFIAQIDEMAVSRKDLEAEIKRIARDKRQLESEMGEMKYKMEVTRQRAIPVIV